MQEMTKECCKLYSLICDPDRKIWIFGFSLGVYSIELRNLVSSLEYFVSNRRQVLLEGIRLGGSATIECPSGEFLWGEHKILEGSMTVLEGHGEKEFG